MLWNLPGPTGFLSTVAADLNRAGVCVIVLPESAPEGIEHAVSGAPSADPCILDTANAPTTGGPARLCAWVAAALAAPFAAGEEPDVASLLADNRVGIRRVVADIGTTSAPSWGALCNDWAEAASRLRRSSHLLLLSQSDPPPISAVIPVRWWWGHVRRLDAEIVATAHAGARSRDPLFVAMAAELGGSDLELVEHIAQHWNGDPFALGDVLPPGDPDGPPAGDLGRAHFDKPDLPKQLRREQVEAWDGRIRARLRACSNVVAEANNRVRTAQLRVVFPSVELHRQRLARAATGWESRIGLGPDEDLDATEIGRLSYLLSCADLPPARAKPLRDAARWLAHVRNKLAHREILDAATLLKGERLLGLLDEDN